MDTVETYENSQYGYSYSGKTDTLKRLAMDKEVPSFWNDDPYLDHVQTWIKKLSPYVNDLDQYLSFVQSRNFAVT